MKDETLQRIREFANRHSIPSLRIGVPVHVDESVPVDEPVLHPHQIRVHPEDYAALEKWSYERETPSTSTGEDG